MDSPEKIKSKVGSFVSLAVVLLGVLGQKDAADAVGQVGQAAPQVVDAVVQVAGVAGALYLSLAEPLIRLSRLFGGKAK